MNESASNPATAGAREPATVVVLGIPFHNVTFAEAVDWVRRRVESRRPGYIATANVDFVMQAWRDPEMQRILLEADLVVADGIPIVWLSRLTGPALKERVTGSDLVPMLASLARDRGFTLYHLGGAPGVPEKAAAELVRRFPGLKIAGCYSPPKADLLEMDHASILGRLDAAQPDILFVAFGAPKQEKFANLLVRRWKVPVSMGVGGSLDFLAGAQKRAPVFVRKIAMEWLWRMLSDPRRLFRRYVGNIGFMATTALRLAMLRRGPDRPAAPLDEAGVRAAAGRVPVAFEALTPLADEAAAAAFAERAASTAASSSLVLDLRGMGWLTSLELGALLRASTQFRRNGRVLVLTGVGSRIRRLLAFCHMTAYLELAGTPAEAGVAVARSVSEAGEGSVAADAAGRIVIRLPVELTAANAEAFRARVEATTGLERAPGWDVDAAWMKFVDSAGIGCLAGLAKRAAGLGIPLRFAGWQPRVRQTLRVARVAALFGADRD